jgi:hypothetical protein
MTPHGRVHAHGGMDTALDSGAVGYAFHATSWAAMERVLLEASEAKSIFLSARCVASGFP